MFVMGTGWSGGWLSVTSGVRLEELEFDTSWGRLATLGSAVDGNMLGSALLSFSVLGAEACTACPIELEFAFESLASSISPSSTSSRPELAFAGCKTPLALDQQHISVISLSGAKLAATYDI